MSKKTKTDIELTIMHSLYAFCEIERRENEVRWSTALMKGDWKRGDLTEGTMRELFVEHVLDKFAKETANIVKEYLGV